MLAYVDGSGRGPGVVSAQNTRPLGLAKLGTRLIDTKVLELGARAAAHTRSGGGSGTSGSRCRGRGSRTREAEHISTQLSL
jgi:hypothetical protein